MYRPGHTICGHHKSALAPLAAAEGVEQEMIPPNSSLIVSQCHVDVTCHPPETSIARTAVTTPALCATRRVPVSKRQAGRPIPRGHCSKLLDDPFSADQE